MKQSYCGYMGIWAQIIICVVVTSTAGTTTAFRQPWWQKPPDPRQTEEKSDVSTLWIIGEERCREI